MNLARFLRRFTIRARMIGATAAVLVLMIVVGGIGMVGLQRSNHVVDDFVESIHRDTVLLSTIRADLGEVRRHEKDVMLSVGNQAKVAEYKAKWTDAVQKVRSSAQALVGGQNDEGGKIARRAVERLGEYQAKARPVWEQVEAGQLSVPADANGAFDAARQQAHLIEGDLATFAEHLKKDSASEEVSRRSIQSQSEALFAVALVVAAIVIVPGALANMAAMCRPIDAARAHARRIAGGDLTADIADDGDDEYTRMFDELGTMQQALRRLVGDLRSASENIGTASAEIATGNTDLSHRTEQTASNLQQAAGSLHQITGGVRQTAESAAQANQLAASASTVAVRGGDAVAQVVATMGEIEASSRKIADIIGTIDGIAFQTNILALNAAVEAARAGEQGRGFAVVAGEVRTLAQRSAEAAREIKSLIGASVERVETGTRLVRDAGSTMNEIVDSVRRVTDVIGEITASTTEQSEAIAKVNGAVTELDRMTQQNAALVEQSAAAAESLKDQANRLVGVVGAFRTAASAAVARAADPSSGRDATTPQPSPMPKPTPRAAPAAKTSGFVPASAKPVAARPAGQAPTETRAPSAPASEAQQVIERARVSKTPAGSSDAAESDWESF